MCGHTLLLYWWPCMWSRYTWILQNMHVYLNVYINNKCMYICMIRACISTQFVCIYGHAFDPRPLPFFQTMHVCIPEDYVYIRMYALTIGVPGKPGVLLPTGFVFRESAKNCGNSANLRVRKNVCSRQQSVWLPKLPVWDNWIISYQFSTRKIDNTCTITCPACAQEETQECNQKNSYQKRREPHTFVGIWCTSQNLQVWLEGRKEGTFCFGPLWHLCCAFRTPLYVCHE